MYADDFALPTKLLAVINLKGILTKMGRCTGHFRYNCRLVENSILSVDL